MWRLKYRHDGRPGLPIELIWSFYPKYAWESVSKVSVLLRSWLQLDAAVRRIRKDPKKHLYMDQALADMTEDETDALELFTHSDEARHAVKHARNVARITAGDAVV